MLITVHYRTEKKNIAKNSYNLTSPYLFLEDIWTSFQQPKFTLTVILQSLYWNI